MTVDYAALVTAVTTGLTPALAAGLGLAGTIIAIRMGYRFFKSFAKG